MKKLVLIFAALSFVLLSHEAEARRRKKSKIPIIVNQILRLNGTMTNNEAPTMEFAGVKEGDVLETGAGSAAVIRIPGLGIYRLGENTKLKLTKFGGRDITKFELFKGDLLSVYKRLGSHEIKSENTSIIPNGNASSNVFWLADLEKKVNVSLWDGRILIKTNNAELTATTKDALKNYLIQENDIVEKEKPQVAPPDSRFIKELESLFALP